MKSVSQLLWAYSSIFYEDSGCIYDNTGSNGSPCGSHDLSDFRGRAQFKCAQTVVGQSSAGNGPDGLSYDYYYYTTTTIAYDLSRSPGSCEQNI